MSKLKAIKLTDIVIDIETQQRERINEDVVSEYAEAMRCGAKFPPVTLFFDGAQYWLADGYHRYHASKSAPVPDIQADIIDGTKRDARLFSAGSNGTHGARLTNADKRKSAQVLLLDWEWSQWSDHTIAKHCHVTQPFISKLREVNVKSQLITVIKTDPEAAPVLEATLEKTPENAENQHLEHEEYTETQQLEDTLKEVLHNTQDLRDRLAMQSSEATPEEKSMLADSLAELRSDNEMLRHNIDAITRSRDALMIENGELKRQIKSMQRKANIKQAA